MDDGPHAALQVLQRRDRRHQLHPIVGGCGLESRQFLFDAVVAQQRAPAARAGIAAARTVGEDFDDAIAHESSPYAVGLMTPRWKRSFCRYSTGSFCRTNAPGAWCSRS